MPVLPFQLNDDSCRNLYSLLMFITGFVFYWILKKKDGEAISSI